MMPLCWFLSSFPQKVQLGGGDLDTLLLCSHELLLPDRPTLHTRMLLGAWEAGLDAVSEEAADLLVLALEVSALCIYTKSCLFCCAI